MKITDLMDPALLAKMRLEGYVRQQTHPTEPLVILNYTEKAQFEGMWNDVTRNCRGLIYDINNYEIVARPFPKFFNLSEYGPDTKLGDVAFDLSERVVVTDKLDGSLGIAYRRPSDDQWAVATRGSFTSDQALHATAKLQEYIADPELVFQPCACHTYLFEIVYPENRIVVDYRGLDELILLGAMEKDCTGCAIDTLYHNFMPPEMVFEEGGWNGFVTETFSYESFQQALEAEPRPGKEGLVVYFPERDFRVKIKQEEYIALHRIVTGLNERMVWERMFTQDGVRGLTQKLPEEFVPWVHEVYDRLLREFYVIFDKVSDAYEDWGGEENKRSFLVESGARRNYAEYMKDNHPELLSYAFLRYDQNWDKLREKIWKDIKPEGGKGWQSSP